MTDAKEVEQMKELVNRFLSWPLPPTVCSDTCVSTQNYPHRVGTNLLTADEAEQMLKYVVGPICTRLLELEAENEKLGEVYRSVCPECGYTGCVRGKKACDSEIDALKSQLALSQARSEKLEGVN